ncbi:MAG: hypothetical protein ACH349_01395 [Candidatus Rhabdochlamydia sp.]
MKNFILSLFLIPSLVYSNAVDDEEKLKEHLKNTFIQSAIADIYISVEMSEMSDEDRNRINQSVNYLENHIYYFYF